MDKLTLRMDDLSVESFDTLLVGEGAGTVLGNDSDYTDGSCPGLATCNASCNPSCNASCVQTCAGATCNGTCGFSCGQSCYATCRVVHGECMAPF